MQTYKHQIKGPIEMYISKITTPLQSNWNDQWSCQIM